MNTKQRDDILRPYITDKTTPTMAYFSGLPLAVLRQLVDFGLVEMSPWNSCDGVAELFLPFLKRNPEFTAHGFFSPGGDDEKAEPVIVEGVEREGGFTKHEILDFINTFQGADEIQTSDNWLYCWYD